MNFALHPRLIFIYLALFGACGGFSAAVQEKKVTIPLAGVYAFVPTKNMIRATGVSDREMVNDLRRTKSLTPNVYLVGGKDIDNAIKHTHKLIYGSEFGDFIKAGADGKAHAWVVLYLGISSSSPPMFSVDSIERIGMQIKINYQTHKPTFQTLDNACYYFWIPLGELSAGKYQLQVNSITDNEIVLSRRVTVITTRKQ